MDERILSEHAIFDQYETIFALGENFLSQGKYEKALTIFDGLIALDPCQKKAAIAYGQTLLLSGKAERALSHFYDLSKQFGMDGATLLLTAKACILLDRNEEAKKILQMISEREIQASQKEIELSNTMLDNL